MLFDDENWKVIHNSRPPLRWIANLAGDIACKGLIDVSYMQNNADGWKYRLNLFLWNKLYPIYRKYGTVYQLVKEIDEVL